MDRPIGNLGGRVVVWSSSADGKWNTIPLAAGFVPLIQETMFHLSGPLIVATQGKNLDAGKPIIYSNFDPKKIKNPTIRHLSETVATQLSVAPINGRSTLRYDKTFTPGLYELNLNSQPVSAAPSSPAKNGDDRSSNIIHYAIGIDSTEMDTTVLSPKDVDWLKENNFIKARISADKMGVIVTDASGGRELWPLLAFATLAFLVIETFMTFRMMRHQTAKPAVTFA